MQNRCTMPTVTLPYEPNFSGHREAKERDVETKRWLSERERLLAMKQVRVPARESRQDAPAPDTRKSH